MPRTTAKKSPRQNWFSVTYIQLFLQRPKSGRAPLQTCFAHENTVLLRAQDHRGAYDRCVSEIGPACLGEYKEAFDEAVKYDGEFGGVISVVEIGRTIGDYSEVNCKQYRTTIRKVKASVPTRAELLQSD